jgi:hypothetical protein
VSFEGLVKVMGVIAGVCWLVALVLFIIFMGQLISR